MVHGAGQGSHTSRTRLASERRELRIVLGSAVELAKFRGKLRKLLVAGDATAADREAVVLATVEALNNALQACEPSACRVEVTVSLVAGYVCVEVRDAAAHEGGICVNLRRLPGQDAEHGRGLYLMSQLMESLETVARSQGTLVRMTKQLGGKATRDDLGPSGRLAS